MQRQNRGKVGPLPVSRCQHLFRLICIDVSHEDIPPTYFTTVRLQHDGAFVRKRLLTVPEVFHHCAIDNEGIVEPDPRSHSNLANAKLIPLTKRPVRKYQRITARGTGRIVKQASRTQVRLPRGILRIEDLIPVPDLNLRCATQIDAAVGIGDCLVFNKEFDISEFLVSGRIRPVAVVDEFTVFHAPVFWKLSSLRLEVRVQLFAGQLCGVVRIQAVPSGKILTIEYRMEAFRRFGIVCSNDGGRKQRCGCHEQDVIASHAFTPERFMQYCSLMMKVTHPTDMVRSNQHQGTFQVTSAA